MKAYPWGPCCLFLFAWAAPELGCGSSDSGRGNTNGPGASQKPTGLPGQVRACAAGTSSGTVDAHLGLVRSLDQCVHELVACGGLTVSAATVLIRGIIQMIATNDDDITPDGLVFEGDGVYRARSGTSEQDTDMSIRFYDDASGAPTLVTDNLFASSTYLVGARAESAVHVDPENLLSSSAVVEISYEAVGPRVAMLGFGEAPPNPLVIEGDQLDSLRPRLEGIALGTSINVLERLGNDELRFEAESGPDRAQNIFDTDRIDYRMIRIEGTNAVTGQALAPNPDGWQIEFAGSNTLNGSVDFTVQGGAFDYSGRFAYSAASFADISLSCAK